MNYKRALRRAVYKTPLPGGRFMLLGALAMLVWAVWECVLRVDAMDGMTKAYFALARKGEISLRTAIQTLWETPEARRDWLNPLYLCLIALFAVFALFAHKKWAPGFAIVPLCALTMLYNPTGSALASVLNLFVTVKYLCAGAVALGAGTNVVCALSRRARARRRILAKRRRLAEKQKPLSHGTRATLVPPRQGRHIGAGM